MKKIRLIEIAANIRATFASFFSVLMFVALGVAVFLGLQWGAAALAGSFDRAFASTDFHDIEIQIPYGLSEDDIAQIKAVEGVERLETGYVSTQLIELGGASHNIKLQSLPETLDRLIVEKGTAPARADEIALMARWARANNIKVGDHVSFVHDGNDADGMRWLKADSFRVSALVESPGYAAKDSSTYSMSATSSGSVSCVGFATRDAFDESAFMNGATSAYIRCADVAGLSSFSTAYRERVNAIADRINSLAGDLTAKRIREVYQIYASMRDILLATTQGYRAQVDAADAQVAAIEARRKRKELSDAEAKKQTDAVYVDLDSSLSLLNLPATIAFDAYGIALPGGAVDHTNVGAVLDQLDAFALDAGKTEIEMAGQRVTLDSLLEKADTVPTTFAERGRQAFVLDRAHNGGVMMAQSLIDILHKLRFSMASLFVIVGLLVCYSAISRIIYEDVVRVGTKKALGFRSGEITVVYLAYAGAAVVIGVAVGAAAAVLVVQRILNAPLANVFVLGRYPSVFSLRDTLLAGAVELGLILLTAWLSCRNVLKRDAVDLLAGQRPPTAKPRFFEGWALWQRLPLLTQTVVNNCLNERRRGISTLVGVAGCTALVVCALTLNNNVVGSFDRQYQAIYGFDAIALLEKDSLGKEGSQGAASHGDTTQTAANVSAAFAKSGLESAAVVRRTVVLSHTADDASIATLFVPLDEEAFAQLYHLIGVGTSKGVEPDLSREGAWVSEGFADAAGIAAGDTMRMSDSSGETHELAVLGVYEHHLITSDVVMGAGTYEKTFGIATTPNALLVNTHDLGAGGLGKKFASTLGFASARNDKALAQRAFTQFSRLSSAVVLVYLVLSVVMAVVVLLNLDIMYISEKKRELIVLMICGYTTHQAKSYVRNDTIVLTVVGTLLGIALGVAVGYATVRSVEPTSVVFLRGPNAAACAIGAATSIVLASIVGAVALRRIPRLRLTDINRF